jgi:predicted nucleic acid-binding protein
MSLNISKLSDHPLDGGRKYFLDANVWIFALGNPPSPNTPGEDYIKFLDRLIESGTPIYSHTILISEVFNALMRINFQDYLNAGQYRTGKRPKLDFKRDFRGKAEYLNALSRFKSDIQAYLPSIQLIDKEIEFELGYLTKNIPTSSDFNDYLFYEMALAQNLTVVTDDGDFNFSDIEILTQNNWLIKNSRT